MILDIDITEAEAMALAQLCKRFTWDHAVNLSVPIHNDGGRERDAMLSGTCRLADALARHGFAPR